MTTPQDEIRTPGTGRRPTGPSWWLLLFRAWPRVDRRARFTPPGFNWSRLRLAAALALGVGPLVVLLSVPFSIKPAEDANTSQSRAVEAAQSMRSELVDAVTEAMAPSETRRHVSLLHPTRVGTLAQAPDGSVLASGDAAGVITVWDPARGEVIHRLNAHAAAVFCLAISPDGRYLASGSGDPSKDAREQQSAIAVWDLRTGEQVRTLVGHQGVIASLAMSPFGGLLASAGHDRTVRIWDLTAGAELTLLPAAPGAVLSVAFSPDGSMLATGESKDIQLWSTRDYSRIRTLEGHADFVSSLGFDATGERLVSGSLDRTLRVWNVNSEAAPLVLTGHGAGITSVAFHPHGQQVASSGYDKRVALWQLPAGRETVLLSGERCAQLAFDADGLLAVARGEVVELLPVEPAVASKPE